MSGLRHLSPYFLIALFFIGWITYPGWYYEYYSNLLETYAFPASMSGPHDPPWGFWYW